MQFSFLAIGRQVFRVASVPPARKAGRCSWAQSAAGCPNDAE